MMIRKPVVIYALASWPDKRRVDNNNSGKKRRRKREYHILIHIKNWTSVNNDVFILKIKRFQMINSVERSPTECIE
jgi:hypothetical protein